MLYKLPTTLMVQVKQSVTRSSVSVCSNNNSNILFHLCGVDVHGHRKKNATVGLHRMRSVDAAYCCRRSGEVCLYVRVACMFDLVVLDLVFICNGLVSIFVLFLC